MPALVESVTVSGVSGGDWDKSVGGLCADLVARADAHRNRTGEDGEPLPPTMSEDEHLRWSVAVEALGMYLDALGDNAPIGKLLSVEIKDAGTNDGGGLNLTARFLS